MAHAQKPNFVFRQNGRVHLNRSGAVSSVDCWKRGVRISGSNDGYTMFRGCVKCTGYPLHSPVSPLLPHPCSTVCHHISTGLYYTEWAPGPVRTRREENFQPLPRSSPAKACLPSHSRLPWWLSKPAPAVGSNKLSLFLALVFNLRCFLT